MTSSHPSLDMKLRGTVLSRDPLIIYTGAYAGQQEPTSFSILQDALSSREVTWLVLVAWSAEPGSYSAKNIIEWRSDRLAEHPNHRIIFMTNFSHEQRNLAALGGEAFFLNQNSFIDRNLFKPVADNQNNNLAKSYLAVYNAQFLEFKRHELCVNLPQDRLALIGYNFGAGYFDQVKSLLPNANYLNLNSDGSTQWLSQARVNQVYSESSVGLCLSSTEGAMHASMEYLLGGLPIVNTVNKGGRDYFFDGRYVRWCNDDPTSIADSVHALASESIPADFIRSETLKKIDNYLAERLPLLAQMLGISHAQMEEGIKSNYNDKLITPILIDDILAMIG